MSRTLVAVFAHPDDDAYGIAGTVALHAGDPEFRFVLVLATDGAPETSARGSRVILRNGKRARGVVARAPWPGEAPSTNPRVPSLSKAAIRSAGATKSGPPG